MPTIKVIEMMQVLFIVFHKYCYNASRNLNAKSKHEKLLLVAPKSVGEMLLWMKTLKTTPSVLNASTVHTRKLQYAAQKDILTSTNETFAIPHP